MLLVIGIPIAVQNHKVQNYLVDQATQYLSKKLNMPVEIDEINITFFDRIQANGIHLKDQKNETLAYIDDTEINLSVFSLANKKIHIDKIKATGVSLNLTKGIGESDFNIDHLINQFKGNDNASPNEDTDTAGWDISFNQLELLETAFTLDDTNGGLFLKVMAPQLNTTIESLGDVLKFGKLTAQSPDVYIEQRISYNQNNDDEPNPALLDLNVLLNFEAVDLTNAKVEFFNRRSNPQNTAGLFNGQHFIFSNLHTTLDQFILADDTLRFTIEQLNMKERSGFAVNKAKAKVTIEPKKIELSNLSIQTPNSQLQHALRLRFNDIDDFNNFEDQVKLNGNLTNSTIALRDINYFFPLDTISQIANSQLEEVVKISGDFRGKINALKAKNVLIELANHTIAEGKFSLRDITKPDNTFLDVQLNQLKTDIDEIIRLAPQVNIPNEIKKLGAFEFKGNFTGFYNDFVAYGDLNSTYGQVTCDINVKLFEVPLYKGNLQVTDFNVNAWLDEQPNPFGKTSFNVSVNGSGFTLDDLNADVNGTVAYFEFDGHPYKKMYLNGILDQKEFTGKLKIDDPVLNIDFDGAIDLNEREPIFAINSNINNLNFQELNLTNENIEINGKMALNIQGDDTDNFIGTVKLLDVVMLKDDLAYPFGDMIVEATEDDERTVQLKSEIFDATFNGQFSFRDMHFALQYVINQYLSYTFLPKKSFKEDTYANFEISLNDPSLVHAFLPIKIDSLKGTKITGQFNAINHTINAQLTVPQLVFAGNAAGDIQLNSYTENGELKVQGSIKEWYTFDSIKIDNTEIQGSIKNDTLQFVLNTAQADAPNRIMIDGKLSVFKDTLSVGIDSTKIVINDKLWAANSGIIKYLNKDYFLIEDFNLYSGDQYIYINNQPLKNGNSLTTIKGDSLNIEDLASIAGPGKYKVKGTLNGNVIIDNLLKLPAIEGDFTIDDFYYDQTFLGDFKFSATKQPKTKKIQTAISLIDTLNKVSALGSIDYGQQKPILDFNVGIDAFSLQILEDIVGDHIYNTRGKVSGNLKVSGYLTDPDFDAQLFVTDAGTTLRYIQCDYTATNQLIDIFGRQLYFNDFIIKDKNNNEAIVNGFLDLEDIQKIYTDIGIFTAGFQLLDTKRKDNDYFFGQAFAEGSIFIEGYLDDIDLSINATSAEGTSIKLPLDSDYEESNETFYTFVNTGVEADSINVEDKKYDFDFSRLDFFADMQIEESAEIQIIFDQQAGDIIKSRGEGNLRMEISTLGDFNIFGSYEITQGDYLFTLQNIINKKFKIQPGGEIVWSGDPLAAQLDVNAQYERKAVPYDLVKDVISSEDEAQYKKAVNAILNLNMDGPLSKPVIEMSVALENKGVGNFALENRLSEINSDEAQLNRQVVGLLLLNRFLPVNGDISAIASDPLQSGVNTLSEYVSNQVSIYLSDALSNVFDDVNVSYQNFDASGTNQDQDFSNEFQLALGKKFFNDRLYINVGGNLQVDDVIDVSNSVLGGDFLIEYDLTNDGQIKIKAYSRSDYDIFAKYNKTGIGLSYQKSFKDYQSIFNFKKQK